MMKSKASKAYRRARRSRLLACPSGKRAFKTKFDADLFLYQEEVTVHLREINHEHWRQMPIRAYRCPYCKNYHVTSMSLERYEQLHGRTRERT
ncbi:hypothetical protein [Lactobacillus delbrueckii]|uniref:hypothetical protein n=1 Tax=Lactobacillus delbrueckii TaxID=1584 RepID=UPI001F2E281C|nr:hypothetical protein [Lactobacillus delbrueckii]GHN51360.1 hypothetical protein ME801_10290 [Lactobacillus delbrueckii]